MPLVLAPGLMPWVGLNVKIEDTVKVEIIINLGQRQKSA